MRGIFCCSDEIARARVGSMVQRMFLSYTSKNGCGQKIFCFIFCCVGICSDDGDGDGWGTMPKID